MSVPRLKFIWLPTALSAAVVLIGGCGSSSSSSTIDPPTVTGASAVFLKPHSQTNKYVRFGEESSVQDRQAATKILSQNLKAREKANFAVQCSTLSRATIEKLEKAESGKSCPAALKTLADPLVGTKSVRTDKLAGAVGSSPGKRHFWLRPVPRNRPCGLRDADGKRSRILEGRRNQDDRTRSAQSRQGSLQETGSGSKTVAPPPPSKS